MEINITKKFSTLILKLRLLLLLLLPLVLLLLLLRPQALPLAGDDETDVAAATAAATPAADPTAKTAHVLLLIIFRDHNTVLYRCWY